MELTQERIDALSTFSLSVEGTPYVHWTEVELEQSIDGFSSVGFSAPFDPTRLDFRTAFRPFAYSRIQVYLEGDKQLQFTGNLTNCEPQMAPDSRQVKVQATALPHVICDSCVPASYGAKQFFGLWLEEIANDLCKPLGFAARYADARSFLIDTNGDGELESDRGANERDTAEIVARFKKAFPKLKIEKDQRIFDFLTALAKQRGVVMTDSPTGDLVFQRSAAPGRAVASFDEGVAPLISVTPHFSPDAYYSEATCFVPKKKGKKGGAATVRNPFWTSSISRPVTFEAPETNLADATYLATQHLARMFGNAVSWDIELPTIVDPQGEFYRPNTTIVLRAPSAMIYGRHEFLVRAVTKRQSPTSTSCTLNVVLPGAFSGVLPAVLPWHEPLN